MAADGASAAHALVFAIAHEIGNHLGAVRLQAHLLDEDLDPHSLALASVEIDGLAGRAGPLLALLRPLLSPKTLSTGGTRDVASWSFLLAGIGQHFEDEGTRGVSIQIEAPADSELTVANADWLHSLLIALLDATLSVVPRQGTIQLGLRAIGEQLSLMVEDDGPEEDLSADAALRGRALAVALARELLVLVGGQVETSRKDGQTRVELIFPAQRPG